MDDKRYQSIRPLAMLIVFLAMLGGIAVLNLLSPDREFSENENRYLQSFPKFTLEGLVSGKFMSDFDSYLTDQFVFRDGWISMKTLAELALQKPTSGGIYFAKDDFLIEMFDSVDTQKFEKNLSYVASFSERVQNELGRNVNTILAPTASLILSDKLPRNAPEVDQRELLNQAQAALPGFVDVGSALAAHKDEYVYYRTDHHWTSLGAFYAYQAWRAQTGTPQPVLDDFELETLSESFYGTTYSKASLYTAKPDAITAFIPQGQPPYTVDYNNGETFADTIYERSFLDVKDKYSVFLNANQPIIRIHTGIQNGKRLLVVKDSYANAFVQMAMADYEEIVVIDLRYYKLPAYNLMEQENMTDVLILYNIKGFAADTNLYYLAT